jgi:hypothetical protein
MSKADRRQINELLQRILEEIAICRKTLRGEQTDDSAVEQNVAEKQRFNYE